MRVLLAALVGRRPSISGNVFDLNVRRATMCRDPANSRGRRRFSEAAVPAQSESETLAYGDAASRMENPDVRKTHAAPDTEAREASSARKRSRHRGT